MTLTGAQTTITTYQGVSAGHGNKPVSTLTHSTKVLSIGNQAGEPPESTYFLVCHDTRRTLFYPTGSFVSIDS